VNDDFVEEISQGQNYDSLSYDELLKVARGSAKELIPKLCAALKRENPNYSNYDIREIVMKDCIEIWQKGTIKNALPDEYKEKVRQEQGKLGRQEQLTQGGGQVSEFADSSENGNNQPTSTWAKSGSSGQKGANSEDFDKMNRGQDVITYSERMKKLENRLNEQEVELEIVKRQNRILTEKTMPEIFKEMKERLYDEPGILDAKRLHKVNTESGRNLKIMFERYNIVLQKAVEKGLPVPFGMYALTKPDMKLVPTRILVNFDARTIRMSLWEKKLI
jgi:hypothetical protein